MPFVTKYNWEGVNYPTVKVEICYFCEENIGDKYAKGKKYYKIWDHCRYRG